MHNTEAADVWTEANNLLVSNRISEALKLYSDILTDITPGNPAAFLNRALCYLILDCPSLAATDCYRAFQGAEWARKPESGQKYLNMLVAAAKATEKAAKTHSPWAVEPTCYPGGPQTLLGQKLASLTIEKREYWKRAMECEEGFYIPAKSNLKEDIPGQPAPMIKMKVVRWNRSLVEDAQMKALYRLAVALWKCGGGAIRTAEIIIRKAREEIDGDDSKHRRASDYESLDFLERKVWDYLMHEFDEEKRTAGRNDQMMDGSGIRGLMRTQFTRIRRELYPWDHWSLSSANLMDQLAPLSALIAEATETCYAHINTRSGRTPYLTLHALRDLPDSCSVVTETTPFNVTNIESGCSYIYCDHCAAAMEVPEQAIALATRKAHDVYEQYKRDNGCLGIVRESHPEALVHEKQDTTRQSSPCEVSALTIQTPPSSDDAATPPLMAWQSQDMPPKTAGPSPERLEYTIDGVTEHRPESASEDVEMTDYEDAQGSGPSSFRTDLLKAHGASQRVQDEAAQRTGPINLEMNLIQAPSSINSANTQTALQSATTISGSHVPRAKESFDTITDKGRDRVPAAYGSLHQRSPPPTSPPQHHSSNHGINSVADGSAQSQGHADFNMCAFCRTAVYCSIECNASAQGSYHPSCCGKDQEHFTRFMDRPYEWRSDPGRGRVINESAYRFGASVEEGFDGYVPTPERRRLLSLMLLRVLAVRSPHPPLSEPWYQMLDACLVEEPTQDGRSSSTSDTWASRWCDKPRDIGHIFPSKTSDGKDDGMIAWSFEDNVSRPLGYLFALGGRDDFMDVKKFDGWMLNSLLAKLETNMRVTRYPRQLKTFDNKGVLSRDDFDGIEDWEMTSSDYGEPICAPDDLWTASLYPLLSLLRPACESSSTDSISACPFKANTVAWEIAGHLTCTPAKPSKAPQAAPDRSTNFQPADKTPSQPEPTIAIRKGDMLTRQGIWPPPAEIRKDSLAGMRHLSDATSGYQLARCSPPRTDRRRGRWDGRVKHRGVQDADTDPLLFDSPNFSLSFTDADMDDDIADTMVGADQTLFSDDVSDEEDHCMTGGGDEGERKSGQHDVQNASEGRWDRTMV